MSSTFDAKSYVFLGPDERQVHGEDRVIGYRGDPIKRRPTFIDFIFTRETVCIVTHTLVGRWNLASVSKRS